MGVFFCQELTTGVGWFNVVLTEVDNYMEVPMLSDVQCRWIDVLSRDLADPRVSESSKVAVREMIAKVVREAGEW